MVSFNKFDSFVEALAEKVHNLQSDTLRVALTNTPPSSADTGFLPGSSHPPPASASGYSPTQSTQSSSAQAGGTYKLVSGDVIFTASGGQIGPFRYAIMFNDTATNDELIGWWDYGSSITLEDGETFTFDADAINGILQLT